MVRQEAKERADDGIKKMHLNSLVVRIFFIVRNNLLLIFLRVNLYCVLFILLEKDTLEENFYHMLHYRC